MVRVVDYFKRWSVSSMVMMTMIVMRSHMSHLSNWAALHLFTNYERIVEFTKRLGDYLILLVGTFTGVSAAIYNDPFFIIITALFHFI